MTSASAMNEPGLAGAEGRPSAASSDPSTSTPEGTQPVITILSGQPAPEELAALVAVLSAVGGGGAAAPDARRSAWSDPAWRLVGPRARRGGWRTSSLPR